MSQQSGSTSVASSNVNLRSRTGTPRRPRPVSIAGTGVSNSDVGERIHTITSELKLQKDWKPPLPKQITPKKPSSSKSSVTVRRTTPRVTPLQSPNDKKSEHNMETALELENQSYLTNKSKSDAKLGSEFDSKMDTNIELKSEVSEVTTDAIIEFTAETKVELTLQPKPDLREESQMQLETELSDKSVTETELGLEEQCDMSGKV